VRNAGGVRAINANATEVSLDSLREDIPELDMLLTAL
jgi:hypothetical protein